MELKPLEIAEVENFLHTHFTPKVSDVTPLGKGEWWYPAMQNINWAEEARRHYKKIGLEVPNFEERLRCYEISIGLNGMSYNAFKHNWKDLELTTKRTLELALS